MSIDVPINEIRAGDYIRYTPMSGRGNWWRGKVFRPILGQGGNLIGVLIYDRNRRHKIVAKERIKLAWRRSPETTIAAKADD